MNHVPSQEVLALAHRIRELRQQQGMSQADLAEKLGVSRVAITKYETGQSTPSRRLKQIANIFHVSTDYLLGKEQHNTVSSNREMGERIQILRKRNKMKKNELAEKCGVTTRAITSWENGDTAPDLPAVNKLAGILETTTDYILGNVTNEKDIPTNVTLMDGILEQLYNDDTETLNKIKDCKVYSEGIELNPTEKEFLKSSLNVIFKAKGII